MDHQRALRHSLTSLLGTIGRQPLTDLLFTPIAPEDLALYEVVDTPEEAWEVIRAFYRL